MGREIQAGSGMRGGDERRPSAPDLSATLSRFNDALALLSVARRSLESRELPHTSEEAAVLRAALAAFGAVYNEVDAADAWLSRHDARSP